MNGQIQRCHTCVSVRAKSRAIPLPGTGAVSNPQGVADVPDLCDTCGMVKRDLKFGNLDLQTGKPISGVCSSCGRMFLGKPNAGERTDDVLLRVRAEFDAHNCREDASQAAFRTVREATEGK